MVIIGDLPISSAMLAMREVSSIAKSAKLSVERPETDKGMVPSLVMNNTDRNVSAHPSSGANSNPTEIGSSNSTKDGLAPLVAPSQRLTAVHFRSGSVSPLASTVVPSSFGDSRKSAEKLSELLPSHLPSGSASSLVDFEHFGGPGGTIPPKSRDFQRPDAEGYGQISSMALSLLPSPLIEEHEEMVRNSLG